MLNDSQSPRGKSVRQLLHLALALLAVASVLSLSSTSEAQVKRPGAHPRYDAELEPHGVILWNGPFGFDEGLGVGLRAAIPLFHNGPIPKINNNMAIGFGVDWAYFDEPCNSGFRYRNDIVYLGTDCTAHALYFPVVLQWNFYLTKMITVFGEPGLAFSYTSWSVDACPGAPSGSLCNIDDSDFDIHPLVLFAGAKFMFGETVGLTVRLGFPYISVGASFLL